MCVEVLDNKIIMFRFAERNPNQQNVKPINKYSYESNK